MPREKILIALKEFWSWVVGEGKDKGQKGVWAAGRMGYFTLRVDAGIRQKRWGATKERPSWIEIGKSEHWALGDHNTKGYVKRHHKEGEEREKTAGPGSFGSD